MKNLDYIIVGQGIAGSCLGWELLQKGNKVCIFDDGYNSSASIVAAGLMNPITGMRLVKLREIDKFLELAKKYYRELEERLDVLFFKEREILRIFRNELEVKQWEKRKIDSEYEKYLGERLEAGAWGKVFDDFYGSFIIKGGGSLDTKVFLDAMRKYFKSQGLIEERGFDYKDVEFEDEGVCYKEIKAKKIIFCEGYKGKENPWFGNLKWVPAKGEILTIKLVEELPDKIINKGTWLMPGDDGSYRVGANYEWEHLDNVCTKEGRDKGIEGVRELLRVDNIEIIGHSAGIRPCTKDMKPYVGLHTRYKCLGILNGLGSKGVMMAPYYAKVMGEFLETGKKLSLEGVSVERG